MPIRYRLAAFFLIFFASLIMVFIYVLLPQVAVEKVYPHRITIIDYDQNSLPIVAPQATSTPTPIPSPTPGLTPATIIMPGLGITTAVEHVGVTETGNMDVPKNAANVAWYMFGAKPGELGNAVIAGHFDTPTGRPAIFFELQKLEVGDEIEIISENAIRQTFVVTGKDSIPYDQFPKDEFFNAKTGRNVNLITCGGIWDASLRTYLDRVVIYTTLKEDLELEVDRVATDEAKNE